MKVVTAQEMRELDRRAMAEYGIPSLLLMENAGAGAAREIAACFPDFHRLRVLVVAGKGNNGGDGFVVARHLSNRGVAVRVVLLAKRDEITGDAAVNLGVVDHSGIPLVEVTASGEVERLAQECQGADLVVDGILGTGLRGPAQGLAAEAIRIINDRKAPVVALDVPSGLSTDDGLAPEPTIRATLTATFGLPKRGLVLYPGAQWAGTVRVVDIGLPRSFLTDPKLLVELTEASQVAACFPPRDPTGHKGTYGHVLIVGASPGKTGAVALAGLGALRVGAGLVTVAVPERLHDVMEVKLTEVMTAPLPETETGTVSLKALDPLVELTQGKKVLAIGPGLSAHPETVRLVFELLRRVHVPVVVDADGINALRGRVDALDKLSIPLILTPHPGELSRLLAIDKEEIQARRIGIAQEVAKTHDLTLVLKGARTLVADPAGGIFVNPTGNPGMATGGTGDVLTGLIAGLIAQGLSPLRAAIAGVYLHGLAGDLACRELGPEALIAGDLLDRLG
ncbi:MAG: NAD(P)H-hydrate dehydratase, partial [Candidatus Methylomirabilales bacterium]